MAPQYNTFHGYGGSNASALFAWDIERARWNSGVDTLSVLGSVVDLETTGKRWTNTAKASLCSQHFERI